MSVNWIGGSMVRLAAAGSILVMTLEGCGAQVRSVETTTSAVPGVGPVTERQHTIDGRTVETLRATWETEYLEAVGMAPVVAKYPDPARNRELARRGAVADARAKLAGMISAVRVDETTTMADLETSNIVRTAVSAIVQDTEIVSETLVEGTNSWEVRVRMPKVRLLRIVETHRRRS